MDATADELESLPPIQAMERAPSPITGLGKDHDWTDEEKVEYLLHRGWAVRRIVRKTKLALETVKALVDTIDDRKIAEVAASDEKIQSRQVAYLQEVAAEAFERYEQGAQPRVLKIGMEALAQIRKIRGLDAPEKRESINLNAHVIVNREQNVRAIQDPVMRELMLQMEERRRALGHQP